MFVYNFMQKMTIPTIRTFLQVSLLLLPTAALHCYVSKSSQTLTPAWLLIGTALIFLNAYTIDLASRNLLDTIQQTLWMFYALLQSQSFSGSFHFAALGVISVINPTQFIAALLTPNPSIKGRKIIWLITGFIIGSAVLLLNGVDSKYFIDLYFPQTMQPQYNLQWMLYACTFTRFIKLYQLLFMIMPFMAAYLIRSLKFHKKLQMVLFVFFRIYCSYKCSQFALIMNIFLCALILKDYITTFNEICYAQQQDTQNKQKKVITIKTLTMISIIVNICFFPLNKVLINQYINGFRVNFGYVFLFSSIFWGVNAIFLTQISILHNQLNQKLQIFHLKSKQN